MGGWLLSCLVIAALVAPVTSADEPGISLRWALGAWDDDGADLYSIQRDTKLAAGTRLKFLVEPTSPSTVYLVLQDNEQVIHVLYRETSEATRDEQGKPTYIPPGGKYFELDDAAGLNTFFLIASAEPLVELENLLDGYESAEVEAAKTELVDRIIGEIRKQHKAHRNFARPVEKPVMIGGQTRDATTSLNEAVDRLAIEVTAGGFYAKTITIDR